MKKALTTAPVFYGLLLLFWIVGAVLVFTYPKTELHLALNSKHTDLLDVIFRIITLFGDGLFALLLAIILLFNNFRRAIMLGASALLSGVLTQFLKRVVFADSLRPIAFFEDKTVLPLVEGVKMAENFSFPSGHTTTAFALACCLALFYPRIKYQIYFFGMAFLVGFSRIYLSLHFAQDVLVGSVIGVVVATAVCLILSKAQAPWLQRALFKGRVMIE